MLLIYYYRICNFAIYRKYDLINLSNKSTLIKSVPSGFDWIPPPPDKEPIPLKNGRFISNYHKFHANFQRRLSANYHIFCVTPKR